MMGRMKKRIKAKQEGRGCRHWTRGWCRARRPNAQEPRRTRRQTRQLVTVPAAPVIRALSQLQLVPPSSFWTARLSALAPCFSSCSLL